MHIYKGVKHNGHTFLSFLKHYLYAHILKILGHTWVYLKSIYPTLSARGQHVAMTLLTVTDVASLWIYLYHRNKGLVSLTDRTSHTIQYSYTTKHTRKSLTCGHITFPPLTMNYDPRPYLDHWTWSKYLGQKVKCPNIHTKPTALPGPLKLSVRT